MSLASFKHFHCQSLEKVQIERLLRNIMSNLIFFFSLSLSLWYAHQISQRKCIGCPKIIVWSAIITNTIRSLLHWLDTFEDGWIWISNYKKRKPFETEQHWSVALARNDLRFQVTQCDKEKRRQDRIFVFVCVKGIRKVVEQPGRSQQT